MPSILVAACSLIPLCWFSDQAAHAGKPDETDIRVLQVCEGVLRLFEQSSATIWPGYNLAAQPFVVYRANRWALLFGYESNVEGLTAWPKDWPGLDHPVRMHLGPREGLSGQLVFDYPIGNTKGLAIGVRDEGSGAPGAEAPSFEAINFGYVVHEAFHQFQYDEFGEIPWGREERYPILDAENSAVALLEMRLLSDALRAADGDERRGAEDTLRQFVAVRLHRWRRAGSSIENYERGLELREGTAKYVEVKALESASRLRYESKVPARHSLSETLGNLSTTALLLADFEARLNDGAVTPDDMPRNRVYPVGATQCHLLDVLGVEWKPLAQRGGAGFSYVDLLRDRLGVDQSELDGLVAEAEARYGYGSLLAATRRQIEEYRAGFAEAIASFEAQAGQRIEVRLSANGLGRSRVSRARKWLVDDGRRSLCTDFKVYVLTRTGTRLQVDSSGVLELNDWDRRMRTAVCFARGTPAVTINGNPLAVEDDNPHHFDQISLRADNLSLEASTAGTIRRSGQVLTVDLSPATPATANP